MSIENIHLNKLLKLIYLPDKQLQSALRTDIRQERSKQDGTDGGGGDFYQPLWYDIKLHVTGEKDLSQSIEERIAKNYRRKNLYTSLGNGFLELWRRGDNQKVELLPHSPKGQCLLLNGNLTIKVQSIMAISIDGQERLGYPYWFPQPALHDEAARIGLWVIGNALPGQSVENVRIFDIIRSEYYSLVSNPLRGDEERLLLSHYDRIRKLRAKLETEYE